MNPTQIFDLFGASSTTVIGVVDASVLKAILADPSRWGPLESDLIDQANTQEQLQVVDLFQELPGKSPEDRYDYLEKNGTPQIVRDNLAAIMEVKKPAPVVVAPA
ncbi:MAG: hypothetical protein AAB865_03370, partial [Patescibacteria group bacterium]